MSTNRTRLTVRDRPASRAKKAKYPTEAPTNGSPATATQRKAKCNLCRLPCIYEESNYTLVIKGAVKKSCLQNKVTNFNLV
jgi:hypothetical protein